MIFLSKKNSNRIVMFIVGGIGINFMDLSFKEWMGLFFIIVSVCFFIKTEFTDES